MPQRTRRRGLRAPASTAALVLCLGIAAGACDGGGRSLPGGFQEPPQPRPVLPETYRPTGRAAAGDAFVHLFQWTWANVATECEQHLGPAGWKAVQVSPPTEHITGGAWWTVYQPVQYATSRSRSGTQAEFEDMIRRCRSAGVDVYVDIVLNHMSGGSGTGTNGTGYTKYNYPGLWTVADFHPPCGVSNYNDAANVQDCELVGLADLNTGLADVRRKLADLVVAFVRSGVAGFRIDAAKHVQPVELDSILVLAHRTLQAEGRALPYWFSEVIDYGTEAISGRDYYGLGYSSGGAQDITEFRFRGVGDRFTGANGQRVSNLAQFSGPAWGLMPADKAVVFLENHDTQRGGGIWYRDGAAFRLANVWMLAQPYGYPVVLSGYAFDRATGAGRDGGPPHDATNPAPVACAADYAIATPGQWTCEHRDPAIARMVRFRRASAGTDRRLDWHDNANAVAFSRGTIGFVAINHNVTALVQEIPSGLPAGTYCDVLTGGRVGAACAGTAVTVAADGRVSVNLGARSAVALLVGDRL